MGPSTRIGIEADDLTRHLALDLFVNPAGARFLAVQCVAKAARQPKAPLPSECLLALFEALLDSTQCSLEFDGTDPESGEAVLLFFAEAGAHLAPAVTVSHLIEGGRWRSIRALAGLLRLQEERGDVWARADTRGLLVKLRQWGFAGNGLLSYYYDPVYIVVLALEHVLIDVWGTSPIYGPRTTDDIARRALAYDLANFFARKQQARLAIMFEHYAGNYEALCAHVSAYAEELKAVRRNTGGHLLSLWDAFANDGDQHDA